MNKKQWILILVFNTLLALGFYFSNLGAGYERLSSDLHNIVPMCQKFDNPSLFKGDVFAGDTDNFKYYTPFFVQKLRALAWFTNGDYVAAINIWLAGCHILFGLGWFLLAYCVLKNQYWVAFFISILIRGIVWLPGFEIWGIANVWSLMPRTVYISLLPFAVLFLLYKKQWQILLGSFLIGFIFNFHPITGLGGILMYYALLFCLKWIFKKQISLPSVILSLVLTILGMLPFVLTYFGKTEIALDYNMQTYQDAFSARIPSFFTDSQRYIGKWMQLKYLFFAIPLFGYLILGLFKKGTHLKRSLTLMIITLSLLIIPNLSLTVEQWVNNTFGSNLRMAFQLIRVQKLAILPSYAAIGFLLVFIVARFRSIKNILPYAVGIYILLGVISSSGGLQSVPFISDDITREIYPDVKSIIDGSAFVKTDFDKMIDYIKTNTNKEDLFYASYMYRSSAKRPVVLDSKGVSILIEGNPKGLINWYQEKTVFDKLSPVDKVDFLRSKRVRYVVTKTNEFDQLLILVHTEGDIKLFANKI